MHPDSQTDVTTDRWTVDLSPGRKYRIVCDRATKMLKAGSEVTPADSTLIGGFGVLLIANSRISGDNFTTLRGLDFQPVGSLIYPGKSAMLDFLGLGSTSEILTKQEVGLISQVTFGKDPKRQDKPYFASIREINGANFHVFFSPAGGNILHVRLVHDVYLHQKYPLLRDPGIPQYDAKRLSQVFRKARVV